MYRSEVEALRREVERLGAKLVSAEKKAAKAQQLARSWKQRAETAETPPPAKTTVFGQPIERIVLVGLVLGAGWLLGAMHLALMAVAGMAGFVLVNAFTNWLTGSRGE